MHLSHQLLCPSHFPTCAAAAEHLLDTLLRMLRFFAAQNYACFAALKDAIDRNTEVSQQLLRTMLQQVGVTT
jgi:hypothetical protein